MQSSELVELYELICLYFTSILIRFTRPTNTHIYKGRSSAIRALISYKRRKKSKRKEMLGTKEDFELIRQQINIEAVANHLMKKQGKNYIFPSEKSASVRIYPETQSFYDFGRAIGGDEIRLWSHVRDVDSWTALRQIRETFGLNTPNRKNSRDLIRQQEQARQKQQQAEKAEKRRWRLQVEALQGECELYQSILDSGHCEPLSWLWCICQNRLTSASGKADLMCGIF